METENKYWPATAREQVSLFFMSVNFALFFRRLQTQLEAFKTADAAGGKQAKVL